MTAAEMRPAESGGQDEGVPGKDESAELAQARRDLARLAKRARTAIEERDRAILRMRDVGGSLRDIAEAAGVSHQTVANVLAEVRKADASQSSETPRKSSG